MKYIIFASLISLNLNAQNYSKRELVRATLESKYPEQFKELKYKDKKIDFEREWALIFDKQNLKRDHNKTETDWRKLFPIAKDHTTYVSGGRVYYGLTNKRYRYDIVQDAQQNKIIVNVRVHFFTTDRYLKYVEKEKNRNPKEGESLPVGKALKDRLSTALAQAQKRWNESAPEGVEFKFDLMDSDENAHYSLEIRPNMNAVYDEFLSWSVDSETMAHELGHMMGLDEEYAFFTSNVLQFNKLMDKTINSKKSRDIDFSNYKDLQCNLESIMCLRGKIFSYHYDHILRRIE